MLSAVLIDPGYPVHGVNLGLVDVEQGYGVQGPPGVNLVGADDVSLVGWFADNKRALGYAAAAAGAVAALWGASRFMKRRR